MKTLFLSSVVLSALFLAGCSNTQPAPKTPPSVAQQKVIDDESAKNAAQDDNDNIVGVSDTMHSSVISSEEQFIAEMIPHHQEAVDTAKIIVAKGENETLKTIAQAIVDGQSKEISMLQGWLTSWYPASNYNANHKNMMKSLDTLTGHELDDQFMEDMVKHHEGAIQMANQVLELTQKPEIVQFANAVIAAQSNEITEFKKLLDASDRH